MESTLLIGTQTALEGKHVKLLLDVKIFRRVNCGHPPSVLASVLRDKGVGFWLWGRGDEKNKAEHRMYARYGARCSGAFCILICSRLFS